MLEELRQKPDKEKESKPKYDRSIWQDLSDSGK